MSSIRDETIQVIAESLGLEKIRDSVPQVLAPEVEFRMREIIDQALKFAAHAKRTELKPQDINDALKTRNLEVNRSTKKLLAY